MAGSKISKRLQVRTLDALRMANTPLTTSEVAMLVGKSYSATREALAAVGAEKLDDSYPTKWKIDTGLLPTELKKVPSNFDGEEYAVSTMAVDQLILAWNESRETLGASLASTEITPDSDPKKLSVQLGTVAGSIAALAYSLSEVATRPDWFDTLTQER